MNLDLHEFNEFDSFHEPELTELEELTREKFNDKLLEVILRQEDAIWQSLLLTKQLGKHRVIGVDMAKQRKDIEIQPAPEPDVVKLDASAPHEILSNFAEDLSKLVIGQQDGVAALVDAYGDYLTGFHEPGHPITTLLFLGPTGTGKTRAPITAAELLCGKGKYVRIDCAEFQHSHEISRIIGSPPGYIGHRETQPLFTQDRLDYCHTVKNKLSFVIFDEIEKANDALWNLLLGILDSATLTLGDNRKVNFEKTVIVMTSNLGAVEINKAARGSIGFVADTDKSISAIADKAAKNRFTPEFMNRIDTTVTFKHFDEDSLRKIFRLEMISIQNMIVQSDESKAPIFIIQYTDAAAAKLIAEGTNSEYNARELKRVIHKQVVRPLRNLVLTKQIDTGDTITVDVENGELVFLHQYR